jgi:glycosyltransferase involved in cell wall biosynthesis
VRLWETLPPTRRTWRDATVRIVQNETTLGRLPSPLRATTVVLNHAGLVEVHPRGRQAVGRDVLFLGRLERRKGVALAIRALPYARDVRLIVVGEGPARRSLQRLTRRLGVTDRVEFRGRILHAQVAQLLAAASAVVFPGLREEGGVALAEAMYAGVPVIVLAHGGARTIASDALDVSRVALIPASSTEEVARAIGEAMLRFCDSPPADNSPNLDPTYYRQALEAACRRALATRVAPHNAAARNDPVSQ